MKLLIAAAVLVLGFGGNAIAAPNFNVCRELRKITFQLFTQAIRFAMMARMFITDAYGTLRAVFLLRLLERHDCPHC